jgi:hypothetical protein
VESRKWRAIWLSPNSEPGSDVSAQDGHLQSVPNDHVSGLVSGLLGDNDTLLDWPQPQGIFEKGTHFHPIEFLKTLQEVYEKLVVDCATVQVESTSLSGTKPLRRCSTNGQPSIKMAPFCSGFSISPSHPPHPINSLYFVTAADTCVSIAFRNDCLRVASLRWLNCILEFNFHCFYSHVSASARVRCPMRSSLYSSRYQ